MAEERRGLLEAWRRERRAECLERRLRILVRGWVCEFMGLVMVGGLEEVGVWVVVAVDERWGLRGRGRMGAMVIIVGWLVRIDTHAAMVYSWI